MPHRFLRLCACLVFAVAANWAVRAADEAIPPPAAPAAPAAKPPAPAPAPAVPRVKFAQVHLAAGKYLRAVAVTSDGSGWVGVEGSGLRCYDGQTWAGVALPASCQWEYPMVIRPRTDGLWVGLARSGIAQRLPSGEWVAHDLWRGMAGHRVYDLVGAAPGPLWAATDRGLWQWDGKRWLFVGQAPSDLTAVAVSGEQVFAASSNDGVWQVAKGGLEPLAAAGFPDRRVEALATDAAGRLWAGTWSGVACLIGQRWESYAMPLPKLTEAQMKGALTPQSQAVLRIIAAADGSLWLGTRTEGVWRLLPPPATTAPVGGAPAADAPVEQPAAEWAQLGRTEGLPDPFVRDLCFDALGRLWVATYGGGLVCFSAPMAFK